MNNLYIFSVIVILFMRLFKGVRSMKKIICSLMLVFMFGVMTPSFATHGVNQGVTPRSIGAGACSLLIWPGIGQVINDNNKEKCLIHGLLGLTGIFRFWSCYDALVDRKGGVWDNRI